MKAHIKFIAIAFILTFSLIIFNYAYSSAGDPTDRIEIPSSPNPVGSGARALGMGGAFIAVADDATASSWNPGGLIQLEKPEFSITGTAFHRTEENTFAYEPEASGEQRVSEYRLNYLSAVYPFTIWGHNMIVSLNYQNLYDFSREWHFSMSPGETGTNEHTDYESAGSLSAWGIAYAAQVTPRFSMGFTLNFWENGFYKNEWEDKRFIKGWGMKSDGNKFTEETSTFDKYSFSGFNMNFGILWNVTRRFTIGAVLKTPFKADLKHEHLLDSYTRFPELSPEYDSKTFNGFNKDIEMDMPMSYGIGFAYRFSDAFTVSADVYRTEWDDFIFKDANGNESSPVNGKPADESGIDPTHQVRMGFEYLFIKPAYEIPLCMGVFYDPAPAEGGHDDFFGFSIGSGIGIGRFKFDLAYQYRFGNNVGSSILKDWGLSQDVREHTVYSSVIIHF